MPGASTQTLQQVHSSSIQVTSKLQLDGCTLQQHPRVLHSDRALICIRWLKGVFSKLGSIDAMSSGVDELLAEVEDAVRGAGASHVGRESLASPSASGSQSQSVHPMTILRSSGDARLEHGCGNTWLTTSTTRYACTQRTMSRCPLRMHDTTSPHLASVLSILAELPLRYCRATSGDACNLSCTRCDFRLLCFRDNEWCDTLDAFVLRNAMPDEARLKPHMRARPGAYVVRASAHFAPKTRVHVWL